MAQLSATYPKLVSDHWPDLLVQLRTEVGDSYTLFRRSLAPDFSVVWRDILLGYLALSMTLWLVSQPTGLLSTIVASLIGGVLVGCAIAYLQLFLHEAAHYNLALSRARNDALGNFFIAWQVGTTIEAYRRVHFEHHRHLGEPGDTERSYSQPLRWRTLFLMATGIYAVRIFLSRQKAGDSSPSKRTPKQAVIWPLLRGVTAHLTLLATLVWIGAWAAVGSWIIGMAIIFPMIATLRPMMEHRPCHTDSSDILSSGDAVSRMFDDGIIARIFGGAGFNRHLLHHWEPQVSYTRLADLEAFLCDTSIGDIIAARRTTYPRAFRDILAHDRLH